MHLEVFEISRTYIFVRFPDTHQREWRFCAGRCVKHSDNRWLARAVAFRQLV